MTAYYNEIDPYAAQWLRNLIAAGHIAPGDVDERSIVDVRADDLAGYDQCHFFAGIGGWSVALRLAGWPDARPVWTGSCPCQPFSAAGAGKAADDSRHLWPAWFPLIAKCRPPIVFGEQVEAAIGWGWLDVVFADLEGEGYACGATVLPACGVGAPHIRQRCWFVADSDDGGRLAREQNDFKPGGELHPSGRGGTRELGDATGGGRKPREGDSGIRAPHDGEAAAPAQQRADGSPCELADAGSGGWREQPSELEASRVRPRRYVDLRRGDGSVADADGGDACAEGLQRSGEYGQQPQDGRALQLGHADDARPQGWPGVQERSDQCATRAASVAGGLEHASSIGRQRRETSSSRNEHDGPSSEWEQDQYGAGVSGSHWRCDWLPCTDGKARPVEPGTFPLATGIPGRVGRLRAYGNAIVPQVAAEFIKAAIE